MTDSQQVGPYANFYQENGEWRISHLEGWWGQIFDWGFPGEEENECVLMIDNILDEDNPSERVFSRMRVYPVGQWIDVREEEKIIAELSGGQRLQLWANPGPVGSGITKRFVYDVKINGEKVDPDASVRDPDPGGHSRSGRG